jgi:hypothetical protein
MDKRLHASKYRSGYEGSLLKMQQKAQDRTIKEARRNFILPWNEMNSDTRA